LPNLRGCAPRRKTAGGRFKDNPRVLVAALSALLLAPPVPGPWHRLGPAVTSRPGKQTHFFRTATNPKALGVVVTSSSARRIRLHWWSYCEFESDDAETQEDQATVTGVHTVVAYPPVLSGATLCYVSVVAQIASGKVVAAVFDY
jgi:hypothetical protein